MKTSMILVLMAFAVPALAQMQPPPPSQAELLAANKTMPLKGDNVIFISTSDNAEVAYKKLSTILLGAGYTIDRADKELLFVNTKPRPAPRYNMEHAPRASITTTANGAKIALRDAFTLPGAAAAASFMAGQEEVVFRGGKSSTFMVCWDELQRIAGLYPGGQLSYAKQP